MSKTYPKKIFWEKEAQCLVAVGLLYISREKKEFLMFSSCAELSHFIVETFCNLRSKFV